MPINEDELDTIDEPHWRSVLDSMEKGKFYSLNEMSERIVGKRLFDDDSIKQFLPDYRGQRFVAREDMFVAMKDYLSNIAYVFSLLLSELALENLRMGHKDNKPYFSKRYAPWDTKHHHLIVHQPKGNSVRERLNQSKR